MVQYSEKELRISLEIFPKNKKHRASWHAGATDQIRNFTVFDFSTKF